MADATRYEGRRAWEAAALTGRERYHLLTSLVVPRPVAWVSTRAPNGAANLAPFSYFMAVAHTPMLVAISVGSRRGEPKDSLRNLRATGEFCINVVTEMHLSAMNESAGDYGPEVDEFERAGLVAVPGDAVGAPYVEGCPAVLECRVYREVDLDAAASVLVIGEVVRVHVADTLPFEEESLRVLPEALRPVGRLGGDAYALPGDVTRLARPRVPSAS